MLTVSNSPESMTRSTVALFIFTAPPLKLLLKLQTLHCQILQSMSSWATAFFILLSLSTIVCFVLYFYIRQLGIALRIKQATASPAAAVVATEVVPDQSSTVTESVSGSGIDPTVLRWLPVFIYSAMAHNESLECALCLKMFAGGEEGRLLPRCYHSFHRACIDMWFATHTSCPLCRAIVVADVSE